MHETFVVPDVHCDHCKQRIEGALLPVGGVEEAIVDLDKRFVTVTWDEAALGRAQVVKTIEDAGYPVTAS
ncbi:MAG: heavy-metal-associated domain-containing protein [Actinomycetota bacterium]|nr:heavy-metal-associated domain-containing protein [Actinomycetota bacterium]